jgi:hypothetical protein
VGGGGGGARGGFEALKAMSDRGTAERMCLPGAFRHSREGCKRRLCRLEALSGRAEGLVETRGLQGAFRQSRGGGCKRRLESYVRKRTGRNVGTNES